MSIFAKNSKKNYVILLVCLGTIVVVLGIISFIPSERESGRRIVENTGISANVVKWSIPKPGDVKNYSKDNFFFVMGTIKEMNTDYFILEAKTEQNIFIPSNQMLRVNIVNDTGITTAGIFAGDPQADADGRIRLQKNNLNVNDWIVVLSKSNLYQASTCEAKIIYSISYNKLK